MLQKLDIKIKPYCINIKNNLEPNSILYNFIHNIYLSLDTEMTGKMEHIHQYLYEFNNKDDTFLFNKLKEHTNWEYYLQLKNFNSEKFVNDCINEIELSGLLKLTNGIIEKFKDKELNKRTKLLKFINSDVETIEDLYNFYGEWKKYFNNKCEKYLEKYNFSIKEVIEDLNGNRPYNENARINRDHKFI